MAKRSSHDKPTPQPRDGFDPRLEAITERLDPFMAWLGLLFALLVGYELAVDLSERTAAVLWWIGWAIWVLFAVEFLLRLLVARSWGTFLRRNWIQAFMLAVPTLRVLRVLRLARLGRALPAARVASSSYRTLGSARRVARSRMAYLAGLTSVVIVGLGELAFVVEPRGPDGTFETFPDSLLWSAGIVLGQQADPVPSSVAGRLVMNLGFLLGLAVVAALAGTLGAWFVEGRRERGRQRGSTDPRRS